MDKSLGIVLSEELCEGLGGELALVVEGSD